MCGGGDIYEMAGAIYKSAGDISRLKGTDLNAYGHYQCEPRRKIDRHHARIQLGTGN